MTNTHIEEQEYVCLVCLHNFLHPDDQKLQCPHCGSDLLEPVIQPSHANSGRTQ